MSEQVREGQTASDARWRAEFIALVDQLIAQARSGRIDGSLLSRAAGVLPCLPSSIPMLDELAVLAEGSGDPALAHLIATRRQEAGGRAPPPSTASGVPEADLLATLHRTEVARSVRALHVVGAHRYQERELLEQVFPALERVVLYEPHPQLYALLVAATRADPKVVALPYAVADFCGSAEFHVTNNDAASSSLLPMKRHRELFPHVREVGTIEVQVRTLDAAIAEHRLPAPDALLLDVQGAEYQVISALSPAVRAGLRLVYTEASTEEVYAGARTLEEIAAILEAEFQLVGFAPLLPSVPTHGNALFVRRGMVRDALRPQASR